MTAIDLRPVLNILTTALQQCLEAAQDNDPWDRIRKACTGAGLTHAGYDDRGKAQYAWTGVVAAAGLGMLREALKQPEAPEVDPRHAQAAPVHVMEIRPRATDAEFNKAWTFLQEHLLNEMSAGEPEGRAVLDTIDAWLADTKRILAVVEPPGRRAGISDVWNPLTASWMPMPSAPVLMMRERLPGDQIAVSASGYQKMRDDLERLVEENTKLCLRLEALESARAGEQDATKGPLHQRIVEVIQHLEQIPGFPTFEPTSSARLARDALADALPVVRTHETGERTAQVFDLHSHTFKPQTVRGCAMVERERTGELVAIPRRIYDELEDRIAQRTGHLRHAQAVAETLWHTLNQIAAVQSSDYEHSDAGELVSYREKVRTLAARRTMLIADLPADETISDGAWLGVNTIRAELEELARLRKQVEQLASAQATRFVDVSFAIGAAGEPRTVLRFDGLPDISLPDNDAYWLVGEFVSKSRMASRVAEAITKTSNYPEPAQVHVLGRDMGKLIGAVMQALGVPASTEGAGDSIGLQSGVPTSSPPHVPGGQFPPAGLGEPTPRNYTLPASTMSYFSGAGGGGAVHIATDAAGEIVQVTCHDVGPEPDVGDEDSLAERCKVAADNLSTLLGPLGGEAPEPLRSGIIMASNLLSEAAHALQPRAEGWFWIVDEYNDNEGETFGIAILSSPEVDAALEKWCRSFAAITAAEDGRAPDEDPFEQKLGTGDSLTFRQNETAEDLEAIERHSDNDYSSRLRMLKPDGVEILLKAIAGLPPGGSLSLYKGTLSTCFADAAGEPEEIADLWKHCDEDMFEDDGLGEDEDPTEEAIQQRHAEDMASHDEFLRATAVPEDYQA